MEIVIYARFSSNSQREESIERQINICEEYAKRNNLRIIDIYSDKAVSGKTDNRPNFKKLINDSSKHIFEAVLVSSLDRFGRNLQQTLANENKLKANNVALISVKEPNMEGPAGRLNRHIMLAYAQYYSDELSQKIKEGMELNASKCLYNGGGVPLGYKIDEEQKFQIDHQTAPIVQKMFEMYADGSTITEISNYLNSMGIKSSKGRSFNKNSFHTIFTNKKYIGTYSYNGKEIPHGIPQIISNELFNKVYESMEKNKKAPARSKAKIEYLLTTKLFCGHCKNMMTGFSGTSKQKKVYHYYICNGRKKKLCDKKMVSKEYIEDLVVSECRRLLTSDNIQQIANEIVALIKSQEDNTEIKHLQKLLSNNERRQENTINAITECDIESIRKTMYDKLQELKKEYEEIKKQIALESPITSNVTEAQIKFFLNSLKKGNADDIKYRKALITIFVNKIYLYDDRITITYNSGDAPVTISDKLLSKIEDKDMETKNLFLNGCGPPKFTQSHYSMGFQSMRNKNAEILPRLDGLSQIIKERFN